MNIIGQLNTDTLGHPNWVLSSLLVLLLLLLLLIPLLKQGQAGARIGTRMRSGTGTRTDQDWVQDQDGHQDFDSDNDQDWEPRAGTKNQDLDWD